MPIYEYACGKCRKHHEILQKMSDKPLTICPNCGGKMKKLISNTSFVLKGTGWYATDYADKNKKESKEKSDKKTKTETTTTETKEQKKESKPASTETSDTK